MHNPTQGSGLAVCVVIVNCKFAKIECLLTVILTFFFFLRDIVWFSGGWGEAVRECHIVRLKQEASGGFQSPLTLI